MIPFHAEEFVVFLCAAAEVVGIGYVDKSVVVLEDKRSVRPNVNQRKNGQGRKYDDFLKDFDLHDDQYLFFLFFLFFCKR